jgi:predicted nucleotide-binding protein (sugar kinase/HSP70/actin superfamily)
MSVRVGVPQGLLYFQYGTVLERFLSELGAEVVLSGETSRYTLDCGSVLDEMCLPAKVFFGHACCLRDKVDYLFLPRIVSIRQGQYTCPKIIGMPDVLRNNVGQLPPIIDTNIDMRQKSRQLYHAIVTVGQLLGCSIATSLYAWFRAWQYRARIQPVECGYDGRPRLALIGHPYIIYDSQVSLGTLEKLKKLGMQVFTPEMVEFEEINRAAARLEKKLFWSNSHTIAGAAMALMAGNRPLSGIIFMTCFACGPDAMVGELIRQQASYLNIPCMQLSLDEHTAEAGLVTRLEAFTDMVKRRKNTCL